MSAFSPTKPAGNGQAWTSETPSETLEPAQRPLTRRTAGGFRRLVVLAGRLLLWAVLAVLVLRGGVGVIGDLRTLGVEATPGAIGSLPRVDGFPGSEAEALAARFALEYLTYDADDAADRAERLASYADGAQGDQLGWDRVGQQTVRTVLPAGVTMLSADRAVVTVAALTGDDRWLHLSVPIARDDRGRLAVADLPALVAAPQSGRVGTPQFAEPDADVAQSLRPMLESFFAAYADGRPDDLTYFLPVGRSLAGLGSAVTFDALLDVEVSAGGAVRHARATVRWMDPATGASLNQRYDLQLVDDGGRWYVDRVGPVATQDLDGKGGTP